MSAANTKQQLISFDKELIIDEIHNLLNTQQIAKLINNCQQNAHKTPENKSDQISGKELDEKIDELMEQLNIPQKSRDGILKLPEQQKRTMLQQYTKQLTNQAPPPPQMPEHKEKVGSKNTFIIRDKMEIVYQSWLLKKGKLNSKWRKRWFVLYHNNTLAYFEKPEHVKNKKKSPLGEISLYFVTEIVKKAREDKNVGKKYKFELVSKDRTFVLKSEDPKPYNQWIEKITARIHPTEMFKGWANKRGNEKKTWKKRYFVLVNYDTVNSELRYYEDSRLRRFKGLVDLVEVNKIEGIDGNESTKKYGRGNDKCLELVTDRRTYVMSFKDVSIRNQWKDEVTRVKFDDDIRQHVDNKLFKPSLSENKKDITSDEKNNNNNTKKQRKSTDEVGMGMSDTLMVNPMNVSMQSNVSNEQKQQQQQQEQQPDEQENNNNNNNEQQMQQEQEEDSDSFVLDITEDNTGFGDDGALSEGWIVLYNEDGVPYYYNELTQVTQWEKPT